MFNDLKPVAKALVTAHFARTNPGTVNMPTDIDKSIARAFYLSIDATIAGDTDKAEEHFCVLQDADVWEQAGEAVRYIQSLSLSAHALHRHGKLAADRLKLQRIGDDLDDLDDLAGRMGRL